MDSSINGKMYIVTGASTGIGEKTAEMLAEKGARPILIARRKSRLDKLASRIEKEGGTCEVIPTDLSDRASLARSIRHIKKKHEAIDGILNVAGVWHSARKVFAGIDFENYSTKVIDDTMNVGIESPMVLVKNIVSMMPPYSHVINITGTFGDGAKGWLPYYTSKKALEAFTVGLAEELKEKKILVNAVSPSDTATQSYRKWFPEYCDDALATEDVANEIISILESKTMTGNISVVQRV